TVDHGTIDRPGRLGPVDSGDQRQAGAPLITHLGNPAHELSIEGVAEEIGEVIHHHDADGVDLAGAEKTALRVGTCIAELAGARFDALAHLGAHDLGPAEYIRRRSLRDPGRTGHIGKSYRLGHRLIISAYMNRFNFE